MVRDERFKFGLEAGKYFLGERFNGLFQLPVDFAVQVSLEAGVSKSLLLDPALGIIARGYSYTDNVECVKDDDSFEQFVPGRVCVAAESSQGCDLEVLGEIGPPCLEPTNRRQHAPNGPEQDAAARHGRFLVRHGRSQCCRWPCPNRDFASTFHSQDGTLSKGALKE